MSESESKGMTIPVRVDRSHIITIGKRLYAESLELIRELVNNAYDADATEVRITIREDEKRYLFRQQRIYEARTTRYASRFTKCAFHVYPPQEGFTVFWSI